MSFGNAPEYCHCVVCSLGVGDHKSSYTTELGLQLSHIICHNMRYIAHCSAASLGIAIRHWYICRIMHYYMLTVCSIEVTIPHYIKKLGIF